MLDNILTLSLYIFGFVLATQVILKAVQRLELSRAKNPSLGGHVRWAKRLTALIP